MVRSRQQIGSTVVGPVYQPAVSQLIYSRTGDWHRLVLSEIDRRIKNLLPQRLRTPWHHVNRQGTSYNDERAMNEAAAWIAQHGAQHGFRPLAQDERARAAGAA
eukprot:11192347-Lingulodinium_polyedra.AAC.1